MRDLLLLAIHLVVTIAKLLRPGGVRAVAAEFLLLKQQLIVSNRSRQRAPNLTALDRFVLGLITLFVRPRRIPRLSAIVKPATLFKFHKALVDRKYRLLFFSSARPRKPCPKGPSAELIAAIIEMKCRNLKFGYMKIALQISHAFGLDIDKDVVRRVLATHYRADSSGSSGPSWLTLIAQSKDSLWSVDLFRCESILLRSFWVMVVMDEWGFLRNCRYLIHDRDTKYTESFRTIIESGEVKPLKLPARCPNLNAYAERWVRSVKEECLSNLILIGEGSLRRALNHYLPHYHEERNHQGKGNVLLFPSPRTSHSANPAQCRERLGGLLRYYHREAA